MLLNWKFILSGCFSNGVVEFKDVSLKYGEDSSHILKKICFKTIENEKVGIVGRTGAGKSTLINVLSRICEVEKGKMILDGIDISEIPLSQLRDNITVIPQDPTLFDGSIKFNLDALNKHADEELVSLLLRAGLGKLDKREKTSEENKRGGRKRKRIQYDDSDS